MDDLSEQEWQLIQMLREQTSDERFNLSILRVSGLWSIALSYFEQGSGQAKASGGGATFAEAWDRIGPDWATRPRLEVVVDNDKKVD